MFTTPLCVTCHMSHATYHMSCVICHTLHVNCHKEKKEREKRKKKGQSGGASQWRVFYQEDLPRLIFFKMYFLNHFLKPLLPLIFLGYSLWHKPFSNSLPRLHCWLIIALKSLKWNNYNLPLGEPFLLFHYAPEVRSNPAMISSQSVNSSSRDQEKQSHLIS